MKLWLGTTYVIKYILFHIIAFTFGTLLDVIVGDPYFLPHPIRLIGNLIGFLDKTFMGGKANVSSKKKKEIAQGLFLCVITISLTILATGALLISAYIINDYFGIVVEGIFTFYILAAKSLYNESMKVYKELKASNIEKARYNVSMIVGRDTASLNEEGIAKAAVETVAENTSDGVIAPMIYTAIGGPILGMAYKAINTMDSMVGYHNDRYENFGKIAAKLDDVVNYFPSRISAMYMIISAYICGVFSKTYSGANAFKIWKRDRRNHKSPNSAQTESVAAGALGLRLAGPASYFGKVVEKPYIGDSTKEISYEDILNVNKLMFVTEAVCFLISLSIYLIMILILS